jgi:hypothetical protein
MNSRRVGRCRRNGVGSTNVNQTGGGIRSRTLRLGPRTLQRNCGAMNHPVRGRR